MGWKISSVEGRISHEVILPTPFTRNLEVEKVPGPCPIWGLHITSA